MTLTNEQLVQRARQDYGELVQQVDAITGYGIDVHLIGGVVVQYFPTGQCHVIEDEPTLRGSIAFAWARLLGWLRNQW